MTMPTSWIYQLHMVRNLIRGRILLKRKGMIKTQLIKKKTICMTLEVHDYVQNQNEEEIFARPEFGN
ncbi:hypothetical protein CR513_09419, partial [Mucuna pruriens]